MLSDITWHHNCCHVTTQTLHGSLTIMRWPCIRSLWYRVGFFYIFPYHITCAMSFHAPRVPPCHVLQAMTCNKPINMPCACRLVMCSTMFTSQHKTCISPSCGWTHMTWQQKQRVVHSFCCHVIISCHMTTRNTRHVCFGLLHVVICNTWQRKNMSWLFRLVTCCDLYYMTTVITWHVCFGLLHVVINITWQ